MRSKTHMNRDTHGSQRPRIRHYQAKLDVQKCAQNFRNRLFVWVMARHSKPGSRQILRYRIKCFISAIGAVFFYQLRRIFISCTKRKRKKVIQDFFFSDLRAGGTKRAGDVTVENFEKKSTKLFTRSIPTIVLMLTMLGNDHRSTTGHAILP